MTTVKIFTLFFTLFSVQLMATEEAEFTLIHKENNFEIREYSPRIIAQVSVSGNFNDSSSAGFKSLADYILGNNVINDKSQKIAMTAPVVAEPTSEKITITAPVLAEGKNSEWLISFVMPKEYSMESLPKPNNSAIILIERPREKYAVVVFSGLVRESNYNEKAALLNEFVKIQGLSSVGSLLIARYNPPWTLPFFRRNELMVKVR
jgi:hypothetical protein